jgi:hypothetical protein
MSDDPKKYRGLRPAPANDDQIVVPHPTASGLHIVAWFPDNDNEPHAKLVKADWPPQTAYRLRAVQLIANMVVSAESERFGDAIPKVIP